MSVLEVLLHVPGDREAAIAFLEKSGIPYKELHRQVWIKGSFLSMDQYGEYGSRICLDTTLAKAKGGQPIGEFGWGERYLPFGEQVRMFNALKRAVEKHRKGFYRETEERMLSEKQHKEEELQEWEALIDFERGVGREEHEVGAQLAKMKAFIRSLQCYLPTSTFTLNRENTTVDNGGIQRHMDHLDALTKYIEEEELESLRITGILESPLRLAQGRGNAAVQKKHLKKLSSMLGDFSKEVRSFRKNVRSLQVTTPMRKQIEGYYLRMERMVDWYAMIFRKESKK